MTDMTDEHTKECKEPRGCGLTKPVSAFSPNQGGELGRLPTCKECRRAEARQRAARPDVRERRTTREKAERASRPPPTPRPSPPKRPRPAVKVCGKCHLEKRLAEFGRGNGAWGRYSYCKPCKAAYARERYGALYPEQRHAYARAYYHANKERIRDYLTTYRARARNRTQRDEP